MRCNRQALLVRASQCHLALNWRKQHGLQKHKTSSTPSLNSGILPDAVTAKTTGDWGGLAYIIGCAIGSRAPVKFGLLFAVGDLLEPQRN
jgi:hypothetical protein